MCRPDNNLHYHELMEFFHCNCYHDRLEIGPGIWDSSIPYSLTHHEVFSRNIH